MTPKPPCFHHEGATLPRLIPPADAEFPRLLLLGDGSQTLSTPWERLDPEEVPPDRPLPYPDHYAHALVLERPLDELTHAGAWQLVREAWRILKPGGVFAFHFRDFTPLLEAPSLQSPALAPWLDGEESVSVWTPALLECLLNTQDFNVTRPPSENSEWAEFEGLPPFDEDLNLPPGQRWHAQKGR